MSSSILNLPVRTLDGTETMVLATPGANWQTSTQFFGAWTTTTPTPTPDSGAFGSATCTLMTMNIGKIVFFQLEVDVITVGTASGNINVPLGFTATSVTPIQLCNGLDRTASTIIISEVAGGTSSVIVGTASAGLNAHAYAASGVIQST